MLVIYHRKRRGPRTLPTLYTLSALRKTQSDRLSVGCRVLAMDRVGRVVIWIIQKVVGSSKEANLALALHPGVTHAGCSGRFSTFRQKRNRKECIHELRNRQRKTAELLTVQDG